MTALELTIPPLAALMGVALTLFGQHVVARGNRLSDLEKERMKLAHEAEEKRQWLIRERLERMHLLVGEIGREFSMTFLVIEWENKPRRLEFHEKYRSLCIKLEEAQMIADLYVQDLSESLAALKREMNHYWGNFAQVLHLEERGQKVDHTDRNLEEAFTYSRSIPQRAYEVQREIRVHSARIMQLQRIS